MKLHYPQTLTEKILYTISFIIILIVIMIILGYTFKIAGL
jgi:cell division protein FtsL